MEAPYGSDVAHTLVLPLSDKHLTMLKTQSTISPDVIAGRGYYTAQRKADVPDIFKDYQRRRGLAMPAFSPDGITVSALLRSDKPRFKNGKYLRYESPAGSKCIIDVHPFNMGSVRDTNKPLWVTEGIKKGDSLTSRKQCTITLTGVWNGQKDGQLLPCWDHVALKDRKVYVVFDSDVMTKEGVQLALQRLVLLLEERGAEVYVIYLPDAEDGTKLGVDDYLASGGTVAQLKALATRFEPKILPRIRLSRDERLAAAVDHLWRLRDTMPATRQIDNTRRAVMRDLITAVEKSGKVTAEGVQVERSERQIYVGAGAGAASVHRALVWLEDEAKYIKRIKGRKKEDASTILLYTPPPHQGAHLRSTMEGEGCREKESQEGGGEKKKGFSESSTVSIPDTYPLDDRGAPQMRAPDELPELRWSYVEKQAATMKVGVDGKAMHTVEYQYRERLGKKRGGIVEYLLKDGGSTSVAELMENFAGPRTRRRDFISRNITPLVKAGVVDLVGDTVTLTEDWREALENARTLGGEQEQCERQRERYQRQSKGYRNRHKVKPEPVHDAPQVDDMTEPWPHHPEPCSCRECEAQFGKVIGEHPEGCFCSECKARRDGRTPEPRRRHLYVVADATATPVDASNHSLDCECDNCLYPLPQYARPWKGAR